MRMAGQVWLPKADDYLKSGGCASKPEEYPAQPRGGWSHGPSLIGRP